MTGVAASTFTFSVNSFAGGIVAFLGPGFVLGFVVGIWARGRGHFK